MVARRQDRVGLLLVRRTTFRTQPPARTPALHAACRPPLTRARAPPGALLKRRWAGMPASLAMEQMQLISEQIFPAVRAAG